VDSTIFNGYYQPYVDQAWSKYTNTDLNVDTQAQWGVVTGRVTSDGLLTFPNVGTFAKPAAADIFSCSTGPFGNYPTATSVEMGAIGARCTFLPPSPHHVIFIFSLPASRKPVIVFSYEITFPLRKLPSDKPR
jgi:hypothetical protein